MLIKFDTIQDQRVGFELLTSTPDVFTYLGKRGISINHRQAKLLKSKNVNFKEIPN